MSESAKACSRCGEIVLLEEFPPCTRSKDGHRSWCRPCTREYQRQQRAAKRH